MLDVEQILAETQDHISTILEVLGARHMAQLARATAILLVLLVFVRVDDLDHLFFLFFFEGSSAGTAKVHDQRILIWKRESLAQFFFLVCVVEEHVPNVDLVRLLVLVKIFRHGFILEVAQSLLMLLHSNLRRHFWHSRHRLYQLNFGANFAVFQRGG